MDWSPEKLFNGALMRIPRTVVGSFVLVLLDSKWKTLVASMRKKARKKMSMDIKEPRAPRHRWHRSQLGLEEEQTTSGNFIFKAALAAAALCLGGVLCLRFRRRSAGREEYGTRYGRSYVMDNL